MCCIFTILIPDSPLPLIFISQISKDSIFLLRARPVIRHELAWQLIFAIKLLEVLSIYENLLVNVAKLLKVLRIFIPLQRGSVL